MNTPELDKILKVKDKSQTVGEFLEWFNEQSIELCRYNDHDRLVPIADGIETLLEKFFGIDPKKAEEERRAILKDLRDRQDNEVELK